MHYFNRIVSLVFLSSFLVASAYSEVEIPALRSPVIDEANLLSSSEERALEEKIRSMLGTFQMQVWIIKSLEGDVIENLGIRAATKWKLGSEKEDNGVIFLIAPHERKMRFEVGRGLEGVLTDALVVRIMDNEVRPRFRNGRFFEGIQSAVTKAYELASGGEVAEKARQDLTTQKKSFPWLFILILILWLFISFGQSMGLIRRRGYYGGGFGGGWGGSGGGFGGGSSWGGGGGSFGGGGGNSSW